MLSVIQPQPLQLISINRSATDEAELQFAPDAVLSTPPVQVLQPVLQAPQQAVQEVDMQTAIAAKPVRVQS